MQLNCVRFQTQRRQQLHKEKEAAPGAEQRMQTQSDFRIFTIRTIDYFLHAILLMFRPNCVGLRQGNENTGWLCCQNKDFILLLVGEV